MKDRRKLTPHTVTPSIFEDGNTTTVALASFFCFELLAGQLLLYFFRGKTSIIFRASFS